MIRPPSTAVYADARQRLEALAKPVGALGRVEDLAAWLSACQGTCPPRPVERVRAVILAGDHGVSHYGVSAYPREVTAAMVRAFVAGVAAASCLARQHDVALRVLDLGVDDDLADLPAEVSAYHIGPSAADPSARTRSPRSECRQALAVGRALAEAEIAAGADLLILGDMGIGNTTPAAALIAASFGVGAEQVVGRGTGIDDERLAHKTAVLTQALHRMGDRVARPAGAAGRAGLGGPGGRRGLPVYRGAARRTGAAGRHRLGGRARRRRGARARGDRLVRRRSPLDRAGAAARAGQARAGAHT